MEQIIPLSSESRADDPEADKLRDDGTHEVTPDVAYKRLGMVNIAFFGHAKAGDQNFVLIDAGMPGTQNFILSAISERFGKDARPAAIILTHGHIDHVGELEQLVARWEVPVYAHSLEFPYLDGRASYPPPDTNVEGGLMVKFAALFRRSPIDVGRYLNVLPPDGTVPFMPGWQWLFTPGHTPGHISLWRPSDRLIIAGDAFVTTRQESVYAVATQKPELHGPPMYFTQNFEDARASVQKLAALEPEIAVTGHGRAMQGGELRQALHLLASDFDRFAVPKEGKYVINPVSPVDGTAYDKA